jgi:hypothetical protein
MLPLNLYARVRILCVHLHARPRVQRAPGLPLRPLKRRVRNFQAKLGRDARRDREAAFPVIARQRVGAKRRPMTGSAKQSMPPHEERMDCFVDLLLAMTTLTPRPACAKLGQKQNKVPEVTPCSVQRTTNS